MASSRKSPSTDPSRPLVVAAAENCLARHVQPGDLVVLALSGGRDSLVLLEVLALLRAESAVDFRLGAVHVHHGLSPQADAWQAFCLEQCRRLAVPCECIRVEVDRNSGEGLEGAARRARQSAFAEVEADWIVLAHHRSDQAETLLFNLLRGSGVAGAAAMAERHGRLLRPWLDTDRAAIEEFVTARGLQWCEDESNADTQYARNFLRHQVMPLLIDRFPAGMQNLARASRLFAESLELLDALACLDLQESADFPLPIERLAHLDERRAANALRYLLRRVGVQIPGEIRLKEALRQMLGAAPDRHPEIVLGRHRLKRVRGQIYLDPEPGSTESR